MTTQEIAALVELLNRLLVTQAERLWLQGIIARLEAQSAERTPPA